MAQEKGSDWISSIVSLIKWTIIAFVIWLIVAVGFAGFYYWYKREVEMVTPNEHDAERFGNRVFFVWMIVTLIACYWIDPSTSSVAYRDFLDILAKIQIAFFGICLIGVSYYFRKVV